jgi:hypothetical protein
MTILHGETKRGWSACLPFGAIGTTITEWPRHSLSTVQIVVRTMESSLARTKAAETHIHINDCPCPCPNAMAVSVNDVGSYRAASGRTHRVAWVNNVNDVRLSLSR